MSLREDELAVRTGERIEFRAQPLRLRWTIDELVTSDGHRLVCNFSCGLRVLASPTEQKMLREAFLERQSALNIATVITHFSPAITAAADRAAVNRTVQTCLSEENHKSMATALRQVAEAVAFSCGLELLPPFEVELDSPSYRQLLMEQAQRQLAEQRAAGQVEHLQHTARLLQEFEQLRAATPNLPTGALMRQINPADQSAMLDTLLMSSAEQARHSRLWAVSGNVLVRIQPRRENPQEPPYVDMIQLPQTLRSVQGATIEGGRSLLAGTRTGVLAVDPERPTEAIAYSAGNEPTDRGFNQAILWGDEIWASHAEVGIVAWSLNQPQSPRLRLSADQLQQLAGGSQSIQPRLLHPLNDQSTIFCSEREIFRISRTGDVERLAIPTTATVMALAAHGDELLIIQQDGQVLRRHGPQMLESGANLQFGRLSAAGTLPWLGGVRLLLAMEDGPVICHGVDDGLTTQFSSGHKALRWIGGAADRVVGMSADRQKLILWRPWDARAPMHELHITSLTTHRMTDLAFT
ncbi:MAG: hypothetical protein IT447_15845 [Phycisphaerales bacterium]|jgi:hypothetical protein|nr:hypothetical protein [Phycisphaerales bacterium]